MRIVATGEALATRTTGALRGASQEADTRFAVADDATRLGQAITEAADRWQDLAVAAHKSGFATPANRGIHEAFLSMRQSLEQIMFDGPQTA
ncbi:hypothetical protein BH23ACT6_BH23ACT6_22070 [soil metagenome]